MRLQDIMSTPVETIGPRALVPEARAAMKRKGTHHLVVVDGRKIAGIVSARDLPAAGAGLAVADIMAIRPVTARPQTTIREAANLLRGRGVGCLPIVDGARVVGIVTISDLLALLGRGADRPIEQSVPWTLRGRGPRKSRPTADRQRLAYSR
jgi:CBS domain-containing protein